MTRALPTVTAAVLRVLVDGRQVDVPCVVDETGKRWWRVRDVVAFVGTDAAACWRLIGRNRLSLEEYTATVRMTVSAGVTGEREREVEVFDVRALRWLHIAARSKPARGRLLVAIDRALHAERDERKAKAEAKARAALRAGGLPASAVGVLSEARGRLAPLLEAARGETKHAIGDAIKALAEHESLLDVAAVGGGEKAARSVLGPRDLERQQENEERLARALEGR